MTYRRPDGRVLLPTRIRRRADVFARDRGICAACGVDCPALLDAFREALAAGSSYLDDRDVRARAKALGFDPERSTWWEADHIVPLAEGGEDRLTNLRSLCLPHHAEATGDLRGRLARQARHDRDRADTMQRAVRVTIGRLAGRWCPGTGKATRRQRTFEQTQDRVCRVCWAVVKVDRARRARPHAPKVVDVSDTDGYTESVGRET